MTDITNAVFEKYTEKETFEKIVTYASVRDMWEHSVSEYGTDIAVVDEKPYTYAEIDAQVAVLRGALKNAGIKKGERVGILLPNSVEFARAFLAVATLGCCAVILPPFLDERSVYGCSLKYDFNCLIITPSLAEKTSLLAKLKPQAVIIDPAAEAEPALPEQVCETDPCAVLFTGGTTGKSKGAVLNNGAIMYGVKNGCYGYKDVFSQRYFLLLPLTHVFGLVRNLLTAFYTGSSLYICKNLKNMFREMPVFRPTVLVMVPALAEMALNLTSQLGAGILGGELKYIICGASTVSPHLVAGYDALGVRLFPGYGLTETANLVSGNPESKNKPGSVGIPYGGQELKVVDGELWLKGVNLMDGYMGEPEENENAYCDGWFKTGDLVRFDDEGFLYITGRIKDIIVLSSGEKVSPAELEDKFNTIEVIQDSLVYEDKNDSGAQILTLEVFPRQTAIAAKKPENPEEFIKSEINRVNASLLSYMRISKIVIRQSDFERSPSMKILRKKKEQ